MEMQCEPGFASSTIGATHETADCKMCPMGTYAFGNSAQCLPTECDTGSASPWGVATAQLYVGTCVRTSNGWAPVSRNVQCDLGPDTDYSYQGAMDPVGQCETCLPGTYSTGGSAQCLPVNCAPGHGGVVGATTATDCEICEEGWYSPGGSAPCAEMLCPRGFASPKIGATDATSTCGRCPLGTTSPGGSAFCEKI